MKIKACPFCGTPKKLLPYKRLNINDLWVIKCESPFCGVSMLGKTEAVVIEKWNTRPKELLVIEGVS